MKWILLVCLIISQLSINAQGFNPRLNTTQFKGAVFTPQTPNMSILQRSIRQREEREQSAVDAYSNLNLVISNYRPLLHNDVETLTWFDDITETYLDNVQRYISMGFMNDAKILAVRYQGMLANNAELSARIRTNQEYEQIKTSIISRHDIDSSLKERWLNENQYRFVPIKDEKGNVIGGYDWKDVGGKNGAAIWMPSEGDIAAYDTSLWTGTGFALNRGYIVTNYHVVDGATKIKVCSCNENSQQEYSVTVVGVDKVNDLALLKINVTYTDSEIPYTISQKISETGEEVFVLGYPLTQLMGNEIKLTTGIISAKSGFDGNVNNYQISAPVQPGNSGGPLFDNKGNLVGIVVAGINNDVAQNANYAIKTSCLINLVESVADKSILPKGKSIANLSLVEQVKILKKYVYYIECSK